MSYRTVGGLSLTNDTDVAVKRVNLSEDNNLNSAGVNPQIRWIRFGPVRYLDILYAEATWSHKTRWVACLSGTWVLLAFNRFFKAVGDALLLH